MSNFAEFIASLRVNQVGSNDYGQIAFNSEPMRSEMSFLLGTGVSQCDLVFMDERSVLSGANDDIDLAGVLLGPLGGTITMAELVGIFIINRPRNGVPNTTNLTVGGGTNPLVGWLGGTTPTLGPIRPGGLVSRFETDGAGICAVTPGTGDILRIANSAGAPALYQIGLLGRTVA